jgi:hypothetical protein
MVVTKTSDLDGSYKMDGLPVHTKFKVTYQKQGYMPDEHELTVTAEQEGRLLNLHGTAAYYERKALNIKAQLSRVPGPQQEQAWAAEWTKIANAPLPPAAKGSIARALQNSAPPSLQKTLLFSAYAQADPNVLEKLDLLRTEPGADHRVANYRVNAAILDNIRNSAHF